MFARGRVSSLSQREPLQCQFVNPRAIRTFTLFRLVPIPDA